MTFIDKVELLYAEVPINTPYVLSFTTVTCIPSFVIRLSLSRKSQTDHQLTEQQIGLGEAVPLPGYSDETTESIERDLAQILPLLAGLNKSSLRKLLTKNLPQSPFVNSMIMTAFEMAENSNFYPASPVKIPIVAAISAEKDVTALLTKANNWIDAGYETLKLKVGRDINVDCQCVTHLFNELADNISLRIDANQAYDKTEVNKLLHCFDHPRSHIVELLEQPFPITEWQLFKQLSDSKPPVPLMLDESIVEPSDIFRAADVGADLIKLKLFKHFGPGDLVYLAQQANNLGLGVVMGNGVATEIGNLTEAYVFQKNQELFHGAFEGNGFAKQQYPLLKTAPIEEKGAILWQDPTFCSHSDSSSQLPSSVPTAVTNQVWSLRPNIYRRLASYEYHS